jgi:DNA-entry nuclease
MRRIESAHRRVISLLAAALAVVILTSGCGPLQGKESEHAGEAEAVETVVSAAEVPAKETGDTVVSVTEVQAKEEKAEDNVEDSEGEDSTAENRLPVPGLPHAFDLSEVPPYAGTVWADVNGDVPFFDEAQMKAAVGMVKDLPDLPPGNLQIYGELDDLGRCTGACALVGPETLPQTERGSISAVKPTGWHTVKYDGIDGNYLYNRCHLIGFQLTGQDANEKNLITGTRYLNVEGMLPYEDSVLAYVTGTGNHVLYRVTPVFTETNLLAAGVLMEARSIEDPLVQFCAFCYNVQPGITIDYATGESTGPAFHGSDEAVETLDSAGKTGDSAGETGDSAGETGDSAGETGDPTGETRGAAGIAGDATGETKGTVGDWKYIINVSSRKFHLPGCESVKKMSKKNMQGWDGTREELIEMGYDPCKNCMP